MDFVRFSIYFLLLIRARGVFSKGVADWVFHDPLRYPHRTHPPLSCPGMWAARTKIVINVFIVIWYINDISSPRAACGMAAVSLSRTRTVGWVPFFWSHRYNRTPRILTHELLLGAQRSLFPSGRTHGTHRHTHPRHRLHVRNYDRSDLHIDDDVCVSIFAFALWGKGTSLAEENMSAKMMVTAVERLQHKLIIDLSTVRAANWYPMCHTLPVSAREQ